MRMVDETVEQLGSLDILVNNAGIQISKPSHELENGDFDKVIDVNLRGSFMCAREAIRKFLDQDNGGGVIINVSSVHQLIPKPSYLGYSVSKGGMQNLTRTLALEYGDRNIRRQRHRPGRDGHADQPRLDRRSRQARAGRVPHPAAPRRHRRRDGRRRLLSRLRRRAYITGQTIFVDGGLTLFPSFKEPWSSE